MVTLRHSDGRMLPFVKTFKEFHEWWHHELPSFFGGMFQGLIRTQMMRILCGVEFETPDGKQIKTKAEMNLMPRVHLGYLDEHDYVIYDPANPEDASIISGMSPPITVSPTGEWQLVGEIGADR